MERIISDADRIIAQINRDKIEGDPGWAYVDPETGNILLVGTSDGLSVAKLGLVTMIDVPSLNLPIKPSGENLG
ncbi:hypothetical protein A3B57_00240 [Microgenomates group bacterium RIFCSPLOWO2_01_FULL_47_10]|nr:MAG: hypothetical protein A3B57_00240 [Microgenomates group bacterium RIFCSPLOWO2_01_FULL_47_10]